MLGKGLGGLENASLDFHEALTLASCNVTSVLSKNASISSKFPQNFKTLSLRNFSQWDPTCRYRFKKLLGEYSYDVVLAHGNRAIKLASSIRHKAPVIAVCHTTNYNIRKVLHHIDGAIVLTNHYLKILTEAGFPLDRICLVPNSVRLGPEPKPLTRRDRPLIGGLGRLVPNKGFDVLMRALLLLKDKGVPFHCIIHGVDENNDTKTFERERDKMGLSSEDLSFPGWTPDPERFLRTIDIFCMPSRREVLSIALLQALAAGRPIICTRVPGLEDVFKNSVEGFFVDIENVRQLAQALEVLLLDFDLRIQMGREARKRAECFEISKIGKEIKSSLDYFLKLYKH